MRNICYIFFTYLIITIPSVEVFSNESLSHSYESCFESTANIFKINTVLKGLQNIDGDSELLFIRAQCYLALNNLSSAMVDVNDVIDINHTFPYAHQFRGKIYLLQKFYNKAIKDFKYSIIKGLNYDDSQVYILLSSAYQKSGKNKRAEEVLLNKLEKLRAEHSDQEYNLEVSNVYYSEIPLHVGLFEFYLKNSMYKKAVHYLRIGVRENNGSVELFNRLLFILYETNQLKLFEMYSKERCSMPLIMESQYCTVGN